MTEPNVHADPFDILRGGEPIPIDRPDRARLRALLAHAGLRDRLEEVVDSMTYPEASGVAPSDIAALAAYEQVVRDALAEATASYLNALPRVPVARDPFTNAEVRIAIDTYGVDGPWWNYEGAIRPFEVRPPTLLAFTGGMRLEPPLPWTEHLVIPGPGVPYVIPRLLNLDGVEAVIRALTVGGQRAWTIAYFAEHRPTGTPLANDWGADCYAIGDGWHSVSEDFEPRDTDLAQWIRAGKLSWIAPVDEAMVLHRDAAACPYLGLAGETNVQRLQHGKSWSLAPDVV